MEPGFDVVVVGAGAAGLTAAIAAAEGGAKTIVMDKAPDITNTNTSRSGGTIAIAKEREMHPESPRLSAAEQAERAWQLSGGHVEVELVKTWRENIDETLEWLKQRGLRFRKHPTISQPGDAVQSEGKGAGLNKQLLAMAKEAGVSVLFNTKATKLLTDDYGAVIGVRAMTTERAKDFRAKGVVLATGGFQANQEMLLKYMGAGFAYRVKLTGSPFSTGDGHIMVREVGARLVNMNQFHCRQIDRSWRPGTSGTPGPRQLQPYHHYGIFVNKQGKRFIDEYGLLTRSNSVACSIMEQPEAEVAYIWDEQIASMMGDELTGYLPPGIVIKTKSIEELAGTIDIPYGDLRRTIEEFNNATQEGKAVNLDVPKSKFASRIANAPFYCIYPAWAGLNCTLGGPQISSKGEVIDRDGKPIRGLYACGEVIGGFFFGRYIPNRDGTVFYSGTYQVITSSLSTCIVFARIAGSNTAGLRND